jgi:hypothetical protein
VQWYFRPLAHGFENDFHGFEHFRRFGGKSFHFSVFGPKMREPPHTHTYIYIELEISFVKLSNVWLTTSRRHPALLPPLLLLPLPLLPPPPPPPLSMTNGSCAISAA